MLKKLALAATAVALLMSTASADYYIVQEKATKKCKVVETKPTETTWIQWVRPPSRPRAMLTSRSRQFALRNNVIMQGESGAAVMAALFYGRRFLRSEPPLK